MIPASYYGQHELFAHTAACDNSFDAVLFRRLRADLRVPDGWSPEEFERHIRVEIKRTALDTGCRMTA